MVTVLKKVKALVERLAPEPICDDCITERLSLTQRQHANQQACEIAGSAGFERRKDTCSLCGNTRLVTCKNLR